MPDFFGPKNWDNSFFPQPLTKNLTIVFAAPAQEVVRNNREDKKHEYQINLTQAFSKSKNKQNGGFIFLPTSLGVVASWNQALFIGYYRSIIMEKKSFSLNPADSIQDNKKQSISAIAPPKVNNLTISKQIGKLELPPKIPLSFSQQRLWYFDQLKPDSVLSNLPNAFRLHGNLSIDMFQKALNQIVKRHESLRTKIGIDEDLPYQAVTPEMEFPMEYIDFSKVPSQDQELQLTTLLSKASKEPFHVYDTPLIKTKLIKIKDDEHVFFFKAHHLIWDNLSFDIFLEELDYFYALELGEQRKQLPPITVQYKDFTVWQKEMMTGAEFECQMSYWREKLSGELPTLQLPEDKPRSSVMLHNSNRKSFQLPMAFVNRLEELANSEGVTLYMVFLAAFKTILCRYTGQSDIIVGSPIQERILPEIENLIGFFVNSVVLRTHIMDDPSFRTLLKRIRETYIEAYSNQAIPFESIVEELQLPRDLSRSPLYQAMYTYQNLTTRSYRMGDIIVDQMEINHPETPTDIHLHVKVLKDNIHIGFEYLTRLFNDETMERFTRNYQVLLESIAANPDISISKLSMLTDKEQLVLLKEWNNTLSDYPRNSCLHEVISTQASKSPGKTAVCFKDDSITYKDLDQRSNQVANYLKSFGVGPGALVGISIERSIEMMIGVLGILKAGGAYVPLDPYYPSKRLAFMMDDADMSVLLTQNDLKTMLPNSKAKLIFIDTDWHEISKMDQDKVHFDESSTHPTPDDLAYVIFTSGSTGNPKGVKVPHRAVVNFLIGMSQTPGLTKKDILLAVTTLSFDIHVLEIYLPLVVGAKCVIVSRDDTVDDVALMGLLEASGATIMQATPSTWRLLINAGWQGKGSFKALCGGEAFPIDLCGELKSRVGSLWNMYGPTETTVWSTCYEITDAQKPILIGRPIANTQTYVLNEQMQPVPIGVPGELYIGGDGVTCGYLNRAELTAKAFLPDPFADDKTAYIYKTGDLVRYHSDGNIEYLTRIDNQVKVRGFRIELGEIENAIAKHDAVLQCVVAVKESGPGDQRLVAYLRFRPGRSLKFTEMRNFLTSTSKLPPYMIPQHTVEIDEIPKTPAGKIDRKSLSKPFASEPVSNIEFAAPQTETEYHVASIWRDLLKTERVGLHDNFFDLGGDPLLSVQAAARYKKLTGKTLSLSSLLLNNLQQIAMQLDDDRNDSDNHNIFTRIKRFFSK